MNIFQLLKARYFYKKFNLKYSTDVSEKIEIPNRIPRGPTDILRALESTISRDPTAAHYKYHDDPYLIPMSNVGKRSFALAKEAGRKAAQFIRHEHSELFQHKVADPPIKQFFPPIAYNNIDRKVTIDDLINTINNGQVNDAKIVYNLIKEQNLEISSDTLQDLLEMICFYNSEDSLPDDLIEEQWYRLSQKSKEKVRKTWDDGDFAEELFVSIENPTEKAYAALIQGMSKYYQVNRALELFEEAQKKGFILNTNTFNAIISLTNFIKEDYELRWAFAIDLLNQMEKYNLKPNLGTLNAVLMVLAHCGSKKIVKENIAKTLSEFKSFGIEPSLASWYHIMSVYYKGKQTNDNRQPPSRVLYDIVNHLENKQFQIKDPKDINFFVMAMDVCRNHLNDLDLAIKIHQLLNQGNNYLLIGDSFKESLYFRHYFQLLCTHLPFNEFMTTTYEYLVPNIYCPEVIVMVEVLKQLDLNGNVEFLPRLWSDIIIFDYYHREELFNLTLNIIINNEQLPESKLTEEFSNIAWNIYDKLEYNRDNKRHFLNAEQLGNILIALLRNKDFDKACIIMDFLMNNQQTIVGVPKYDGLFLFLDQSIENKIPSLAIKCIQYCYDVGFPNISSMTDKLKNNMTLDENHLAQLTKIAPDIN